MKKVKLAVIGAGKWGFNHIKTAHTILKDNLISVCDHDPLVKTKLISVSSEIRFTSNLNDILENNEINSVIISTPAETHYKISKACLNSGKNVLVEKPITLLTSETEELIELADKNNLKLMVGHVLLYHPAVLKIKEELLKGTLGQLQYIYSNRLNLGAIRTEENILWSFAPHDISIMQYLIGTYPNKITAHGARFVQENVEDTTLTYLQYQNNINCHIYVSWLHPFKEQRLVVIGDKGMFVFEDTLKDEKLKHYSKGFRKINGTFQKFDDNYIVIPTENKMPLTEEQLHFYHCIENDLIPLTDGKHALEVLKILTTASEQLNLK